MYYVCLSFTTKHRGSSARSCCLKNCQYIDDTNVKILNIKRLNYVCLSFFCSRARLVFCIAVAVDYSIPLPGSVILR